MIKYSTQSTSQQDDQVQHTIDITVAATQCMAEISSTVADAVNNSRPDDRSKEAACTVAAIMKCIQDVESAVHMRF